MHQARSECNRLNGSTHESTERTSPVAPAAASGQSQSRPSVAIVAWQALPAVDPSQGRGVGGLETAAWLFARGLAQQAEFDVSLVIRSPRPWKRDLVEGVRISARVEPLEDLRRRVSASISLTPKWRIKRWRLGLLWEIPVLAITRPFRSRDPLPCQPDPRLLQVQPDLWIAMGVNQEAAGVVATAVQQLRPVVVMIRSNADLDRRIAEDDEFITQYGESATICRYAIAHATEIVCQSEHQQVLLEQHFGREGTLVRNPLDLERWRSAAATSPQDRMLGRESDERRSDDGYVAWVGRYDDFHKRPELAFKIAEQCPAIPFRMVINPFSPSTESALRSKCPANVELIDYVPPNEMPAFLGNSRIFLSTSSAAYEGFPNILLQAAAAGKPIVSMEDFDRFLERSTAGFVSHGSIMTAVRFLTELWQSSRTWDTAPVQTYLQRHHAQPTVVAALARRLRGLIGRREVRNDG